VTNGGVNPVLTILALSMRVSEHLAEELALTGRHEPDQRTARVKGGEEYP
jgi:hypothetical protein